MKFKIYLWHSGTHPYVRDRGGGERSSFGVENHPPEPNGPVPHIERIDWQRGGGCRKLTDSLSQPWHR